MILELKTAANIRTVFVTRRPHLLDAGNSLNVNGHKIPVKLRCQTEHEEPHPWYKSQ